VRLSVNLKGQATRVFAATSSQVSSRPPTRPSSKRRPRPTASKLQVTKVC